MLTPARAEVDLRVPPELNTHFYISYCMIARDMTRPTRAAEPCRPHHHHFLRFPPLPLPPRHPPRPLSQADVAPNAIPNRKVKRKEVSVWREMQVLEASTIPTSYAPFLFHHSPPSLPPLPLPHDACTYACHRLFSFTSPSLGHRRRALQAHA